MGSLYQRLRVVFFIWDFDLKIYAMLPGGQLAFTINDDSPRCVGLDRIFEDEFNPIVSSQDKKKIVYEKFRTRAFSTYIGRKLISSQFVLTASLMYHIWTVSDPPERIVVDCLHTASASALTGDLHLRNWYWWYFVDNLWSFLAVLGWQQNTLSFSLWHWSWMIRSRI